METEAENESFVAKSRPCEGHFAKRDFDSLFGPFFTKKLILLECWICSIEIKSRMSPKKLLPVRAL